VPEEARFAPARARENGHEDAAGGSPISPLGQRPVGAGRWSRPARSGDNGGMAKLSASQIYTLLLDGGFSPEDAKIMTAIAGAESARDVGAVGDVALQTDKWGPSVGLFQIRTLNAERGTGSDRDIEHLTGDPEAQVRAAFAISDGGTNFRPWSTFTSGSYRKFLDEPLQAGVPVPAFGAAPAAAGDPFAIDPGLRPTEREQVLDTDGDGLTDDFEKLFGTDVNAADTDRDSLSDAYETATSHTDPLSADTDSDGLSDALEVAQGGDPGRAAVPAAVVAAGFGGLDTLDTDQDGLSDGFERRLGTDATVADTDADSVADGTEVARGLDPLSVDSDGDGLTDAFPGARGAAAAVPGVPGVPGNGALGAADLSPDVDDAAVDVPDDATT